MFVGTSRCRWLVAPGRWRVRGRIERFAEPAALLLLAERPLHGYELKERVADLVGEHGDVSNLYRALRQWELEGLVRSDWDLTRSGPARRTYRITRSGRRVLEQWAIALEHLGTATVAFADRYRSTKSSTPQGDADE